MEGTEAREQFAAQLRAQGHDDATVEAYLRIAERVVGVAGGWRVLPKHVDEAMRRAEQEGAGAPQLANLKRVGDALVSAARASLAPSPGSAPVTTNSIPLSSEHGGRCSACSGLLSISFPKDPGAAGRVGSAVAALGSMVAVRLFGCFGVLTFILAVASVIALYRGVMTRPKCTQCGRIAPREELDTALQHELDVTRRKALLGAAGFAIGAAVMFTLWIGIAASLMGAQ